MDVSIPSPDIYMETVDEEDEEDAEDDKHGLHLPPNSPSPSPLDGLSGNQVAPQCTAMKELQKYLPTPYAFQSH